MLKRGEIKKSLLGSLEIALLMNKAETRFSTSRRSALRSFIIPACLLPLTLLSLIIFPQPDLADESYHTVFVLHAGRYILTWAIYFGAIYWLVKRLDRSGDFFRFVTATNWLSVPVTFLLLPLVWLAYKGIYGPEEILVLSLVLMLYTSVFTAFMIKRVFRIPWEMAGSIAIFGLMVHNMTRDLAHYISAII